jgi:hypothetical protein
MSDSRCIDHRCKVVDRCILLEALELWLEMTSRGLLAILLEHQKEKVLASERVAALGTQDRRLAKRTALRLGSTGLMWAKESELWSALWLALLSELK